MFPAWRDQEEYHRTSMYPDSEFVEAGSLMSYAQWRDPFSPIEGGKPVIYSEAAEALRKLKQHDPARAAGLKIVRLSELS